MSTLRYEPISPTTSRRRLSGSNQYGRPRDRTYTIGVALYLVVIVLWTTSGFVTQVMYRNGYNKPFLLTYMTTSPLALFLIPDGLQWLRKRGAGNCPSSILRPASGVYQSLETSEPLEELESSRLGTSPLIPSEVSRIAEKMEDTLPLTVRQTAEIAFTFCWMWFIANWAINAAFGYTTVANATIVSSTSGFFTLVIGQVLRVERLTVLKVVAVFTSFMGVVLVSLSGSQSTSPENLISSPSTTADYASQSLFGEALALISAFFYALYVIFLNVKVKDESRIDMRLFLGLAGLFNMLTCWPVGVLLHWTGIEVFELPSKTGQWWPLLVDMAIFAISDYLYVLAVLKTAPLLVTVGISLTIPLAVLGDFVLNAPVQGRVIIGAVLVLVSFVAVGVDSSSAEDIQEPRKQSERVLSRTFD